MKRYVFPAIALIGIGGLGFSQWMGGKRLAAIVLALAAIGAAFWIYRLLRPGQHTPLKDVPDGNLVVFWKPGCIYCVRLLERFDKDERISWVNIYRDPKAAALVRDHNAGNELTPTIRTANGEWFSNPSPEAVTQLVG